MTKLNLIYFSATGNTKKVLQTVAKGITDKYTEYDITMEKDRVEGIIPQFTEEDLVMVGVPVYGGRIPSFLISYLNTIKGNNTKAVFTVNYGNREYEDALIELKDIFEANGFIGIAGAAFVGEHSYTDLVATNRPDENDLYIASDFGKKIAEKIQVIGRNHIDEKLMVKGRFPYVVKDNAPVPPTAPITNALCIKCGLCAETCPVGAINRDDFIESDPHKCMHCNRCIKNCPVNARKFEAEWVKNIINWLETTCSGVRKEPELFI